MSKATLTPAKPPVTETIVVSPATPAKVTLELTVAEAQFLANVLSRVGGDPKGSARKHQQPLTTALRSVGFDHEDQYGLRFSHLPLTMPMTGTITCKDVV